MERMTKKEVKDLSDREIKTAYHRIKRDHSFGLLNDKRTSIENTRLLEEELQQRDRPRDDKRS